MIDGELASIVVQAGAIGVLIFGIWILGFKVIPENRKAMDMIQTNFLTAPDRDWETILASSPSIIFVETPW